MSVALSSASSTDMGLCMGSTASNLAYGYGEVLGGSMYDPDQWTALGGCGVRRRNSPSGVRYKEGCAVRRNSPSVHRSDGGCDVRRNPPSVYGSEKGCTVCLSSPSVHRFEEWGAAPRSLEGSHCTEVDDCRSSAL